MLAGRISKEIEKSVAFIPVQKIFAAKNLSVKLIWIVYLVSTSGLCAFFIYKYISEYLKYNVSSQIDWININRLDFPIITLCQPNYQDTLYIELANQLFQNISKEDSDITDSYFIRYFGRKISYKTLINKNRNQTETIPISTFLLSCIFSAKNCFNEFEYFYDFYYGNCYTFNSAKAKYSTQTGVFNGFQLQLYIDDTSSVNTIFSIENGFKIFINRHKNNFNLMTEGIQIAPGFMTNIALSKYTIKQVPFPYSKCIDNLNSFDSYNSIIYKKIFGFKKFYDYFSCKLLCFQKLVGSKCKCQHVISKQYYYENMRTCEQQDEVCALTAWFDFSANFDVINECDCPIECISVGYTATTSISDYPTKFYADNILSQIPLIISKFQDKSKMTYENIRKRVVSVNVYYDELKETVIEHEIKMSAFDLFSSIGGILSLFIGLSLLSFIEFFEILIMILFQNKKISNSNNNDKNITKINK